MKEEQMRIEFGKRVFLLGASVLGVSLILWYGFRKRRFLLAHGRGQEVGLPSTPLEGKKESADVYVCECGKTIAEGGCPPGYNKQLLGKIKKYERHVIICCGTQPDDWSAKVTAQEGSFASKLKKAISKHKRAIKAKKEKILLTNCDEPSEGQELVVQDQSSADLIVFPDRVRYIGVAADDLDVRSLFFNVKCSLSSVALCRGTIGER